MEKSIDFQLIPFDFWADMFEKTHGYVRIFLGVSIPFFSFLVNDVQSRKKRVFLQSWCVFNLLSVFEETLWRKQMSFLYLSCSEYSFLYFFGHWRSKQKKCFSTILVCPYLTFILWRNIIDKTNNISVFFLAWAYLSLFFGSMAFKAEKKCFSTILVCPHLTFNFWSNIIEKTNVIFVFFLAWAYLSLVFWSMVFKAEKKCFSTILVCPYLTFDFWRNTIENTSAIFCDFLAWAYVTLKF